MRFFHIIKDILLFYLFLGLVIACNEKKKFDGYLYPIKENGLYGYIDSVGNRIIEPQFLWASPFTNGLAMAVVDTIYREAIDSMAYEVGERDSIVSVYRMYVKYGYIDKSGRFAIEPTFICYVDMPEMGYVANDMEGCRNVLYRHMFHNARAMFYDTITWKNGYLNTNGKTIIDAKYYYSEPFSEGLAVVMDAVAKPLFTNKVCINPSRLRCAYLDTLGNVVTDFKYISLTKFCSGRGIGKIQEINKELTAIGDTTIIYETSSLRCFLINKNGEEIKELPHGQDYYGFTKDGISVSSDNSILRSFLGKEDKSYSYIGIDGNFLKPLNGLSEFQLDSLRGCKDIMEVLPENADISAASFFYDGYAGISPDRKHWFVIDKYLIIHGYGDESVFEEFRGFYYGLAAVKRNGKWGYINKMIKEQIPCKYDSCGLIYPNLEEIFEYDIQGNIAKVAYINRNDSLVWENKIPKAGEVKNDYSQKYRKDWGKWIYKYSSFLDHICYRIVAVIAAFTIMVVFVWIAISIGSSKKKVEKEQIQLSSVVANNNRKIETVNEREGDDYIHFYPSLGQYTETIKLASVTPDDYFDKLSDLRPVLDDNGEPIMSSGNFAVVFKMVDKYGKYYAVRCFHREQEGRGKSYKLICEELTKLSSPYLLPIRYLEKELYIDSAEYPVLLMDWVEGLTLDKYIRKIINDKVRLHTLANNFRQMAMWLLNQPFAHGDLKPDNILVKEDGSLVLVDYDGMFVPGMEGQRARELGSPDFRDPSRTDADFDKNIDIFPIISILLSLELLIENKELLKEYGADDRLLFSEDDFRNISNSKIFKIAYSSYNEDVTELADQLKELVCGTGKDVDICSLLKVKEKRNEAQKDNKKRIKAIHMILIIYNILVPLSAFIYSITIPRSDWNVLGVSAIILCTAIALYFIIGFIDLTRPYKRYHLYIDDDYNSIGCIFSLFSIYIPIIGLLSPNYKEAWYISLLVIVIWAVYYMVLGATMSGEFEILSNIFKTNEEMIIEEEEKKREVVRSELRKEKEQEQAKLKELKKQKRSSWYVEDLPF